VAVLVRLVRWGERVLADSFASVNDVRALSVEFDALFTDMLEALPARFFRITVHQLQHITEIIESFGPVKAHWMAVYERAMRRTLDLTTSTALMHQEQSFCSHFEVAKAIQLAHLSERKDDPCDPWHPPGRELKFRSNGSELQPLVPTDRDAIMRRLATVYTPDGHNNRTTQSVFRKLWYVYHANVPTVERKSPAEYGIEFADGEEAAVARGMHHQHGISQWWSFTHMDCGRAMFRTRAHEMASPHIVTRNSGIRAHLPTEGGQYTLCTYGVLLGLYSVVPYDFTDVQPIRLAKVRWFKSGGEPVAGVPSGLVKVVVDARPRGLNAQPSDQFILAEWIDPTNITFWTNPIDPTITIPVAIG
jgi:hypothetical protein